MSTAAPLQTLASKSQPQPHSTQASLLLHGKRLRGSLTSSLTGESTEGKSKNLLQTKLGIRARNDLQERVPDRAAGQVMTTPVHLAGSGGLPRIQRDARQATEYKDTAPTIVDRVLASSGRSLEAALQQDIEQRFGHDFSRVRVHSGAAAKQSARDIHANPHAVGQNGRLPPLAQRPHFDFANIPIMVPPIQRKPTISSPGDRFEREADDVADRVMRMVETGTAGAAQAGIQRKCAECEGQEENSPAAASLQSLEGGEEEILEFTQAAVQRKVEFSAPQFPSARSSRTVADRLAGAKSGGELLAPRTRDSMEAAFGRDFSRVRVHRDSEASELSHQLSALAFTHGRHIYFGSGKYDPEGSSGRRLLAHELAHVVQQGQAVLRSGGDAAPTDSAVQSTPPEVQRVATWAAATVHETNNLANTALDGVPAGATMPMLNGAIGGALTAPTLAVSPVAAGGFDATVTAVPANAGSVDETVQGPGPWRRVAPRATIRARFPTLTQCTGAGDSNFRARGDPSDAAMFAANRRHEDHHGADGQAAFNGSIVPWDTRLTAANAGATKFHGATDAAARAALFAAMGGTPIQVTNAFIGAWNAAIPVFHATAAGGPVGAPTDPTAAADCSWSFARFTNPS